jgi:palmitoyltransferase
MNLLGFDRFTRGKAVNGLARAGKASNPFDLGVFGNCRDFWGKGRELGVEYEVLYDVPVEGFREARRRRREREREEGAGAGVGGSGRKGLFTMGGFGLSGSTSASASRAGYEPVSQTQV